MKALAPSILSADLLRVGEAIEMVENAGAHILHVDVMDGLYVPQISFGQPVLSCIKKKTSLPIDVHLMIERPERYIEEFVQLGADFVSVHVEATRQLHRTLTRIKELGAKAGVVLNPSTPVNSIENVAEIADYILLMSVDPGYSGQAFVPYVLRKIEVLKKFLDKKSYEALLEVDGGITLENIAEVAAAGADILVSGSGIFHAADPASAVEEMIRLCNPEEAPDEE
jgi:ribulose-phosphate 3-epimerase